ncbi:hypothetical protein NU688_14445 [Variovorax sp. ZS18.2.2]|uniref:hypothetical protein n=1 Tax=Variovorax sp. ZS18.2.2 TaxID=2971255 RepID=UPI002150A149|nr:hypothetical protein [Variovorax sp. ZS18.2.2]MCR6477357.1 hypothetical protein [Variovorax sp. ZS18.2.2]
MPNRLKSPFLALIAVLLVSACTSIPMSATPESRFSQMTCRELDAETAMAGESRRVATQARSDSWHVVLPILVAARYVNANSALSQAEERELKLAEVQTRQGCSKTPG